MEFRFDDSVIAVNMPTTDAVLQHVRARLLAGTGMALATLNVDHLVKLRRDPGFRRVYAAHDLVVADGNPVVWLSRLARRPVHLAPGSDLVPELARIAAECGVTVALVGSTPAALKGAADALRRDLPALRVVATVAPPMGFDPTGAAADAVLDRVAASGAGLCFIALGAPKQETLAARGRRRAPQVAFVSVGAGLDFIAGTQRRAPRWVRRLALEWLWRAASAPRRLVPRYANCFAILPAEVQKALRLRRTAPAAVAGDLPAVAVSAEPVWELRPGPVVIPAAGR